MQPDQRGSKGDAENAEEEDGNDEYQEAIAGISAQTMGRTKVARTELKCLKYTGKHKKK